MKPLSILSILIMPALSATLLSCASNQRADLAGDPASPSAADYTIVIHPDTRYVNVKEGDVVSFVAGGKTFAWNFDTHENAWALDLAQVAPPGLLDHPVTAYISPFRRYYGRSD